MRPAAEVPALVRCYLDGALPAGGSTPRQVRVTQVGEMCQKQGGRWLPFTAVEEQVLANAKERGHLVDEAIFRLRAPRHEPREMRFLTWPEVEDLATVEP